MHIFFSGIGGAGIGPLAMIALEAGYEVSGSDKQEGGYIETLKKRGIQHIHVGQTRDALQSLHQQKPIDWIVYSSAVEKENKNHPELMFAAEHGIQMSKRDVLLNKILKDHNKKLIAIAGTHGKTTTTAMCIWACKQIGLPISYSIGAKLSFGGLGAFDSDSEYFVYEADEYDRNFLSFQPAIAIISGVDYDHPDIYPTRAEYYAAFKQFIEHSQKTILWESDAHKLNISAEESVLVVTEDNDLSDLSLLGHVNRKNAFIVASALAWTGVVDVKRAVDILNGFPALSRRFEKIADNVYSDYAHTPEKIRGALQLAHEVAGKNVVVVYEGLHNTRQHFIKDELAIMFEGAKKVYIVPSYLAREDSSLDILTPDKLAKLMLHPVDKIPSLLDDTLLHHIQTHAKNGDLVLCLTAGSGNSLDEWLRNKLQQDKD